MRTPLLPFAFALSLAGLPLGAQQVLQVPSEFPTIQSALDAAQPGSTVKVAPGIYHERLQLREDVDLVGAGWRKSVIDAGGSGDVITADGVHNFLVKGFTLRGSGTGATPGRGVYMHGATCCTFGVTARIELCRITDNGYGIQVENVHSGILTILKNVIDRNELHGIDTFIGTTILERNTIAANGGTGVIATDGGGQVALSSNVVATNGEYGIFRTIGTPLLASYNDVFGNALGDYVQDASGAHVTFVPLPGTSEQSTDPGFYSLENGDYALMPSSPLIDAGDPALALDADGTTADVGAFAFNPFYVPASGSFGQGCGPKAGWFWEPITGQPYYEQHLAGALPFGPAVLQLGISSSLWSGLPLPLDLTPFGAPGCSLLTGPALTVVTVVDAAGKAQINLPIPASPELLGAQFYVQWLVPAPGVNPLGLLLSDGVAGKVKL